MPYEAQDAVVPLPPRQHLGDHIGLQPPEFGMPERPAQDLPRRIQRWQFSFGKRHGGGYGENRPGAPHPTLLSPA